MIAKRDKYLRRFEKTHSLDMEYLYKKFRNKVVTEIRISKKDYYADYFLFFSSVNIKYKFDLLQRFLVFNLSYFDFCDFKNYHSISYQIE